MRCYFLRDGRICDVELLSDISDEAAVRQARDLFDQRKNDAEAFEVWDRARLVYRHPA